MRVIDAFDKAVNAVAVSADGRFLAAADQSTLAIWDWSSGEFLASHRVPVYQLAFSPDGAWLAVGGGNEVRLFPTDGGPPIVPRRPPLTPFPGHMAGGVAFTPNGKRLLASRHGRSFAQGYTSAGTLERWLAPDWTREPGFGDHWPIVPRLVVSANGEFLAGINPLVCEIRFVVSGGLQCRIQNQSQGSGGIVAIAPNNTAAVCGWYIDLYVIDPVGGRVVRGVRSPGAPFRDISYTGRGERVGTVDGTRLLRLWEPNDWKVETEYDWGAGPLNCLAFTADGLAGVCGTTRGQLILFDLE